MKIEKKVYFGRARRNRKVAREGNPKPVPKGRIPRISKLMALAIKLEKLLHSGEVASFADLARLGHVHRSRIAQVMMLISLAPDLQEEVLILARVREGPDPIFERDVRAVAEDVDWGNQRVMWKQLQLKQKEDGKAHPNHRHRFIFPNKSITF